MEHLRNEILVAFPGVDGEDDLAKIFSRGIRIDTTLPVVTEADYDISEVRELSRLISDKSTRISQDFAEIEKRYDDISNFDEYEAPKSCPTITFDPTDIRSMFGALGAVARPLAKLGRQRVVEFSAPKPATEHHVRPPKPLHEGAVESVITPDLIRRSLFFGGVGVTAAAALINSVPNANNPNPHRLEAKVIRAHEVKPKLVVSERELPVKYVVPNDTSLTVVAVDLQVPKALLLKSNPELQDKKIIPAGTPVGGMVKASSLKVDKPVDVQDASVKYGVSVQALQSVNKVDEDGQIHDQVNIPGRKIIEVDPKAPINVDAVAQHLGLGEASARTLNYINANAPEGQLVTPIYAFTAEAEKQLSDPVSLAAVAEGVIEPGKTLPAPTTEPIESTSTTILDSTITTLSETSISTSTTTTTQKPKTATGGEKPSKTTSTTLPTGTSTTTTPESTPKPQAPAEKYYRDALPEEKFAVEKEALKNSLDEALFTNDLTKLKDFILQSPIFKSYHLSGDFQQRGIRHLPPAELLGIPGLKYEISQGTPDNERNADANIIALVLHGSYTFQNEINLNPEWKQKYPNSCLRVGDLSAHEGHKSHSGAQVDLSSSLTCNMRDGHAVADGPIFWINHEGGTINRHIANPNYDGELDRRILSRLLDARYKDQPLLKNILFNAPNLGLSGVNVFPNHNNHTHINGYGFGNSRLKLISEGGGRPELSPEQLTTLWYLAYAGGEGIVGISKDMKVEVTLDQFQTLHEALIANNIDPNSPSLPTPAPAKTVPTDTSENPTPTDIDTSNMTPAEVLQYLAAHPTDGMKHRFALNLLLKEIARHEGSYDSVNRGHAGDTPLNGPAYRNIFGDKPLSQRTIAELLEMQRKGIIFTVGSQQYIPRTFRSAVEATGIDVNRVFDAATQDELSINYLIMTKRPHLAAYIKGEAPESSIYKAVNDLCMEFASMPCPDGSGYYDGDSAGNNAVGGKQRVARIVAILEAARATYGPALQEIIDSQQKPEQG